MNSNRELLKYYARLELARRDFFEFCKLTAPDFYNDDRLFLKDFCNTLQSFYESDKKILVVNMPPRHGKSRTATQFTKWIFGKNPKNKVMTGSYNETLSMTFAKTVRDSIAEQKTEGILSYSDIFPETKIKRGEASANKWALEGSTQANYLATSPTGTATGFGCNYMIIDDLIKSAKEAYNENTLKEHIDWFNNTMLSRTETGFKLIIIMTRWASNDLAGYILNNFDVPLGVQFAVGGAPNNMPSATQWTVATDLKNMTIYYHTMYNRTIRSLDMKPIDFATVPFQYHSLDTAKRQTIVPVAID